MQPWYMRLAVLYHPCDSSTAGDPPGNYLRSDGKLIPLQMAEQPALSSQGVLVLCWI